MSLKGKNTKSIKRKDLRNSRRAITGIKSVKFHDEKSAGETIVNIGSLSLPSGYTNPLPSTLAQLRLKDFSDNLILDSSSKGYLKSGPSGAYEVQSNSTIKLLFEADEGEVITGTFYNHQINGTLIADVRTPGDSGQLLEGQNDFNLGESIPLPTELSNQWPIQLFRGDKPMLMNAGNAEYTGDDSIGNYQLIDSGDGNTQIARFNIPGDVGGEVCYWANHGALAERPDLSVLQQTDALFGIVDLMKDDLLEATGFDVTDPNRYNGVPTNQDLKTFGDRVILLERILEIEIPTNLVQSLEFSEAGSALSDRNQEVRFSGSLTNANFVGDDVLEIVDNAGSTRTEFTALVPCQVVVSQSALLDASDRMAVRKNGSTIVVGTENSTGNLIGGGAPIDLEIGDFITLGSGSNNVQNAATPFSVALTARSKTKVKIKDLI